MTLSEETIRVQYSGPYGAGQALTIPFSYFDTADVIVKKRNTTTGITTTFVITTDYTLSGTPPVYGSSTCTLVASVASNEVITIYRDTEKDQDLDLTAISDFNATLLETYLDKVVAIEQDLAETISRAVVQDPAFTTYSLTLPQPSAGKCLKWNSTANGLINSIYDPDTNGGTVVDRPDYYDTLTWGTGTTQAILEDALADIGSNVCYLFMRNGTWQITSNLAIPDNVMLVMSSQSQFSVDGGVTLTINSPFVNPPKQYFSGAGSVVFGDGSVVYAYPQWFGAVADGATNDTSAIVKCLASCKNIIFIPGDYAIGTTSGITFDGHYALFLKGAVLVSTCATQFRTVYVKGDSILYHPEVDGGGSGGPAWSFGISIEGSCTIIDPYVHDIPYDGIYCNPTGLPNNVCVKIIGGKGDNCGRVGITFEHCDTYLVDGFSYVDAIPSVASIDIEPYDGTHYVKSGTIKNCDFKKLVISSLYTATLNTLDANNIETLHIYTKYPSKTLITPTNGITTYNIGNLASTSSDSGTSVDYLNNFEGVNLLSNSYVPSSALGWTLYGGVVAIRKGYTTFATSGATSAQLYQTVAVTAGNIYSFGCYGKTTSGNDFYSYIRVRWLDGAGATISNHYNLLPTTNNSEFLKINTIMAAPTGAVNCRFDIGYFNTIAAQVDIKKVWMCNGVVTEYPGELEYNQRFMSTAAPTTGAWPVGAVVWNSAPASGGVLGWVCTAAGTPGTWVSFGGMSSVLNGSTTWDPGAIADGDGETKSLTVTGAALGDFVTVSAPYDLQDLQASGYVQATNTVEIRLDNNTGGAVDLGSGIWKVKVFK